MNIYDIDIETLKELDKANTLILKSKGIELESFLLIDENLFNSMMRRVYIGKEDPFNKKIITVSEFINQENYYSSCGCLGPRDGDIYCNCKMNNLVFNYRYRIAIYLTEEFNLHE